MSRPSQKAGEAALSIVVSRQFALNKELTLKKWFVGVFAFFLITISLFGRENTDILIMKNGDRLTCQVKGLQDGALYVSLDYVIQTLSLDWSKVAKIESKQMFIVKTEDGSVYQGLLKSVEEKGSRPLEIEVVESSNETKKLNSESRCWYARRPGETLQVQQDEPECRSGSLPGDQLSGSRQIRCKRHLLYQDQQELLVERLLLRQLGQPGRRASAYAPSCS